MALFLPYLCLRSSCFLSASAPPAAFSQRVRLLPSQQVRLLLLLQCAHPANLAMAMNPPTLPSPQTPAVVPPPSGKYVLGVHLSF